MSFSPISGLSCLMSRMALNTSELHFSNKVMAYFLESWSAYEEVIKNGTNNSVSVETSTEEEEC